MIAIVLEHWSILAYYRSSKSVHSVKRLLLKNKPEQVDRAVAVMLEVADYNRDWMSQ